MARSVAFHTQPLVAEPLAVPTTILMLDQATPATDAKGRTPLLRTACSSILFRSDFNWVFRLPAIASLVDPMNCGTTAQERMPRTTTTMSGSTSVEAART
jgi:hypothetical protein